MILSYFLFRQNHDDSNLHEIIPISFNMLNVLHDRYYNIGNLETYLVQTKSQVRSGRIELPEIHGVSKGLDPKIEPEKQIIKPIISKVKETLQIKPRLGQGRARLRCKKPKTNQQIASIW